MGIGRLGNWLGVLVAAVLVVWASAAAAQKEIRVALVIGNGAYQNAEPLRNPVNDARAMAKVLRDAGFDVILSENATRRALTASLREFTGKLTPGGVGLFYYAGHGMQVRGANYLIPTDAALSSEDELRYETIDVNDVLNRFDEARTRLSLVILDACRDNPFARRFRSGARGLAQADAPRGTVIAYATAPGDTAADGDGENGLYTAELLKAIKEPGLKLEEVFKRTLDGVARASGNKQTPWVSSSFRGDFVFNAAISIPPPAPPPPVAAVPVPAPAPAPAQPDDAQTAWATIAASNNPVMFELYLKRFPNSVYADFARARLEELKAAAAAAADEARRKADADAAKEEARRVAIADEARRKADADAKRAADEDAKRIAAAEEAKRRAAAEDEKKSVENTEAALKLNDTDRKRIQAALTAKGFDTLGTDGSFGPRTRQMIANWQRARNEPPTGFLTATQAALLAQEGQAALSKIEDERRKADDDKRKADAERAKAAPPPQQATAPTAVAPPAAPAAATSLDGAWKITGSCAAVLFTSFTVRGGSVQAHISLREVDGAWRSGGSPIIASLSSAIGPSGNFTLTYSNQVVISGTISPAGISGTVDVPIYGKSCPLAGVRR